MNETDSCTRLYIEWHLFTEFHRTSCWQKAWWSSGIKYGSTKVWVIEQRPWVSFIEACANELRVCFGSVTVTGQKLLDSLAETWDFFFCDVLSMLQAIFHPVQVHQHPSLSFFLLPSDQYTWLKLWAGFNGTSHPSVYSSVKGHRWLLFVWQPQKHELYDDPDKVFIPKAEPVDHTAIFICSGDGFSYIFV